MKEKLTEEIKKLKKDKNAIILAHYYAPGEVQEIADYVGDSYYLAKTATKTDADIVVFCGVRFMGESVKILNPQKTVLMPDATANCPMAHMSSVEKIKEMRDTYEDLAVVCYINSTAELKCHSDVCVTSSNAIKIVKSLPNKNIFFLPDENLGNYIAKKVPEKNIICNKGFCPIHALLTEEAVSKLKHEHPNAYVLTHPECKQEILDMSDFIGSTSEIIDYAKKSDAKEFIICTEDGVSYSLSNNCPDKGFYYPTDGSPCRDMKLNTPQKVLHVLKTGENEIKVSDEKRASALKPLERMLELAK